MIIKMSEFSNVFTTREQGRRLNKKLKDMIENECSKVVIDFAGVKMVTSSFADEFIGKLALDMGLESLKLKTTFKNTNEFIELIIIKAINNRINEN